MPLRLSAFVIWLLVAGSAMFWGMRQWSHGPVAPAYTVPVGESMAARGDVTRLLGAAAEAPAAVAAAPEAASRFRLLGVVAPRAGAPQGQGIAVIAVDGKPGRPFRVGAVVEGELMLREVSQRRASLGPAGGGPAITLELPAQVQARTGSLPTLSIFPPPVPLARPGDAPGAAPQSVPPPPDGMPPSN